jgi:hypothetical protein
MSLPGLMRLRAELVYRVLIGTDEYNQPVYDSVTQEVQCYYRHMATSVVDSTYLESSEVQLFLLPGTQTHDVEMVVIEGQQYRPAGVAEPEYNARTGLVSHLLMTVRRGES